MKVEFLYYIEPGKSGVKGEDVDVVRQKLMGTECLLEILVASKKTNSIFLV